MNPLNPFAALVFMAFLYASSGAAFAQEDTRGVLLMARDFSDCTNSDVTGGDTGLGGYVTVDRGADGNTHVRVDMLGKPNTTYHFFLKCVRLIGDITTQSAGYAIANFDFPTNWAGNVFAFDMYPEGAPSGDKFQSVQVNFSQPPPPNSSISFLPPGQEISRQVFLLPQASSDCTNADVRLPDALTRGGSATVDRGADGNTHVRVRLAGQPSTSYHFFLKCGRQLGDLMTQANSAGIANFNFPTAEVGNVFAFEMYPEGAPPESRYQSLQVRFPETPAAMPSPRIEYIDQTAGSVNFTFADLPAGVEVVYVDSTSGDVRAASPVYAISQGGAGSASIAIDAQTPRNCYLLVRDQSGKHYIAQTIKFYIWN